MKWNMATRKRKKESSAQRKQRFERRSQYLRAEVDELEDSLFSVRYRDPELRYEYLKTFRTEMMRSFVMSLHLAIEDLLRAIFFDFVVRQNRRLTRRDTIRIVRDVRSADLIHWCGRLNLVTQKQYEDLLELNRIRNACAHNWLPDLPRRHRIGPRGKRRQIKLPTVAYKARNLFVSKTFVEEFAPTYSGIYLKLLLRVWKMQGKI